MSAPLLLFGVFAFLASFNAGSMLTLQVQHYGIYSLVGRSSFAAYIRANNRAAKIPVIVPAMLLLLCSLLLVIAAPRFMTRGAALVAVALNVVQLVSTFIWQRRLQAEMAETGYDDGKVRLLVSTNWIRTIAFLLQALLATTIVLQGLAQASGENGAAVPKERATVAFPNRPGRSAENGSSQSNDNARSRAVVIWGSRVVGEASR